uniref:Uncharacterized protein n=1 Tax=Parascaris equorum TaxID=6256 RepID=A0A914RMJ4_PAREQ
MLKWRRHSCQEISDSQLTTVLSENVQERSASRADEC